MRLASQLRMTRTLDDTTGEIIDAAIIIHKALGPGLLESVCERILGRELERRGLTVERQIVRPIEFDGMRFERGIRIDLLVDHRVIVEVKSVERVSPVHAKQVLTYLRLMDLQVGLVINFGCETLKDGLRRVVNNYKRE